MVPVGDLIKNAMLKVQSFEGIDGNCGIPSGFEKLDKITSGWQHGDLITIGGRPGMGKTSFALSMARNITGNFNIPLAYFSMETSSVNLISRLLVSETGLSMEKLKSGKLEPHEHALLNVKATTLEKAPFYIDDTPGLSIESIEVKIKELVNNHSVEIVLIDYLQLMTISDKNSVAANREQHISIIIKKLKYIARLNGIVIVVLSQLSRALETRGGSKRPILSDFRESGAIENDSDIVAALYRPEYYKIDEWDDEERCPTQGQAELIIGKNRNGRLENIRLKFISHLGKFDNLDDWESPFEFHSINSNDNPFITKNLLDPNDAFGSSLNDSPNSEEDNDVPF